MPKPISPTFSIAALNAAKLEGNTGTTAFTFTVTRSSGSGPASISYEVSGAQASDFAGGSYPSGRVNFQDGQTTAIVTILVAGDTTVEANENFTVTLSKPSGNAQITTPTATGTIQNDDQYQLAIAPLAATKAEGNTGTTPFTFTVSRTGGTTDAVTVNYAVTSASGGLTAADFGGTLPSGTVTIPAGQASATLTVNVAGDTTIESNEDFTVTLSSPSSNAQIATATATGTIQNDDYYQLAIAPLAAIKAEGNTGTTPFTFTVSRTGGTTDAVTVNYAITGTGGLTAADFGGTLPSGTVTIPAGQASATLTVNVAGDTTIESNEDFTVTLSSPSSNAQIATATATGTIQNDDYYQLAIAPLAAIKAEGNTSTTGFTFTVSRTGGTTDAVTVNYAVTGTGGLTAADFGGTLPSGIVTIPAGQASATLTVNVAGDTAVEANEDFTVTLSSPSSNAQIGTATATGTIQNDDQYQVSIAEQSATKPEGNSDATGFTFAISRTGGTTGEVTVDYAVTGGAGIDASDFAFGGSLPSGTVTILDGASFAVVSVNVVGDTTVEADEGFTVTISNPSSNAQIATATATGTIQNDDSAAAPYQLAIAALSAVKAEGNTGTTPFTFTVSRTGGTAGQVTVDYAVTGIDGLTAADFGATLPSGTATIADGQASTTVTIDVAGDTLVESDEDFTVTLSNPSGNAQIATATATGTIQNDDSAPVPIQRVSVSSNEEQANWDSLFPAISDGGRYVAFQSSATNLVAGDNNGGDAFYDVFVRDLQLGTTERVSVNSNEEQAQGPFRSGSRGSEGPSISLDGSLIAFSSVATNLVPNDTNEFQDVFVRNRTDGTTELVSLGADGEPANKGSGQASLAGGGGYVAFTSGATNLISGIATTANRSDVFVYDRTTGTTQLVSVNSDEVQASRDNDPNFTESNDPSISADGNRIVFASIATNLVFNPNTQLYNGDQDGGAIDIFMRDIAAGTTTHVSDFGNGSRDPAISADGRYVVFGTYVGDPQYGPGYAQIYLRDLQLGSTELISVNNAGQAGSSDGTVRPDSFEPSVSADGRYVVFTSGATNLVAGDTNAVPDVFVRDRGDGTTIRVSVAADGTQASGSGDMPSISADGRYVTFRSGSNLTGETDGGGGIFVVDGLAQGWWNAPSGNTANTSQVADATPTASLALLSQYAAADFVTQTDGHGGTLVTYFDPEHPVLAASS